MSIASSIRPQPRTTAEPARMLNLLRVVLLSGLLVVPAALTAATSATKASKIDLKKVGEFKLLAPRQGAAAVAYGQAIYVLGGANDDGAVTDIERVDLRTQRSERVF